MLKQQMSNIRASPIHWTALGYVTECIGFGLITVNFTAYPTDTDLADSHSYYTKVMKCIYSKLHNKNTKLSVN